MEEETNKTETQRVKAEIESQTTVSKERALSISGQIHLPKEKHPVHPYDEIYNGGCSWVEKRYVCCECNESFKQNAGLYNHKKKIHKYILPSETATIRCLEKGCNFICSFKEKLQKHLSNVHGIEMVCLEMEFNSFTDFENWKELYEKQAKCRFVKKSGSRLCVEGERATYLYCSRSGKVISKRLSKKRQRISTKISNHCTASIKYIQSDDGKVKVKLCGTHYGHKNEIQLLRMTKSDKLNIAGKLQQGHTAEIILDSIRASAGTDIDRIHLINKKDIKNIEKAHGIQTNEIKFSLNRKFNMDTWVSEISSKLEESPVLFYKAECEPHEKLDDKDICLILMTKGQVDVIKQFGENGAFYVTCMSIKSCFGLYLVALSLVNDINRGVPVSFMITSRTDIVTYSLLCKVLKNKMGDIHARAFLTDGDDIMYEAWISVFDAKPCYLWSHHYVDQDWRDKLGWIDDESIQDAIYDKLYIYLSSIDSKKFDKYEEFVNSLMKDPATRRFGSYFKSSYMGKENLWAGCYKKRELGIYTSLNLDSIYHDLDKVCNYVGKYARRYDAVLRSLLKLVTSQQHHRTTMLNQLPNEIMNRHYEVRQKPEIVEQINEVTWKVGLNKDYAIVRRKPNVCGKECPFFCAYCDACSHLFECSCSVYLFIHTMWCKHIHSVGIFSQKENGQIVYKETNMQDNKNNSERKSDNSESELGKVLKVNDMYKRSKEPHTCKKELSQDASTLKTNITNLVKEMLNETNDSQTLSNLFSYLKSIHQTLRGKRKRGRPPRKVAAIESNVKIIKVYNNKRKLNQTLSETSDSNASSEKSDSNSPIIKRKRGRPKKVLNVTANGELKTEDRVAESDKPLEKTSTFATVKDEQKSNKPSAEKNSVQHNENTNSELRRSNRQRRCSKYIEEEKENS